MPTTYPEVGSTRGVATVTQEMAQAGYGPGPALSDHPTQSATTIDGWNSILFGMPFLLVGVAIEASALNFVSTRKHAPDWLIALIGSFFALAGLFLLVHGTAGLVRRARYRHEASRRPTEPWYADYHWHPEGFTFSAFKTTLGRLALALFWSAFLVPFFWIGMKGAWPFLAGATLFALAGLYIWYRFLQMLADLLRYGSSFLEYDRFPYFLGSTFSARLRTPRHVSDLNELKLTLRCVAEKYVTTGTGENRTTSVVCYELYKDESTLSKESLAEFRGESIPLRFPLPIDKPETTLIFAPPTYWEIEARGTSSKVNYIAYFLVPVYKVQ